ncbi:MAG: hypothetical protein H6704_22790 [Myxococcales bacterium]|nr:hypothetical protein [Myxococcales bacterium]
MRKVWLVVWAVFATACAEAEMVTGAEAGAGADGALADGATSRPDAGDAAPPTPVIPVDDASTGSGGEGGRDQGPPALDLGNVEDAAPAPGGDDAEAPPAPDDAGPDAAGDAAPDAAPPPDAAPDAGPPIFECADNAQRRCEGCDGVQTCVDNRWGPCEGQPERCNQRDDDCDGATDEDFAGLGEACSAGVGACATEGVIGCLSDGSAAACDARPGEPDVETCDGVDQDCDGATDEGADGAPLRRTCYGGADGTEGVGLCAAGVEICEAGAFGACVGGVSPRDETCDGVDEDCDGHVDEGPDGTALTAACYEGPGGTEGVGICRGGERACVEGAFGPCEGQVRPAREICDGLDNDCNGAEDDGEAGPCACEPGVELPCYTGPVGTAGEGVCTEGRQACRADGGGFGPCNGEQVPDSESCDGTDEDCDGAIDEAIEGTGAACMVGVGACAAAGTTVCDGDAGTVRCDAAAGAPAAETCNGADDDCDGRTDEGQGLGERCANGVGACRRMGAIVCGPGGATVCDAPRGLPGDETCNGLDDDCDGETDEALGLGAACAVGQGACRVEGVQVCGVEGALRCDAEPRAPDVERCNGVDDDCDGRVDEADPALGQACDSGAMGACGVGARRCTEGVLQCAQTVQPAPEACNDLDDDCDGATDEAVIEDCYDGPMGTAGVGPCVAGVRTCVAGRFGGCAGQVLPAAEACDQVDNDCNGAVDDLGVGSCVCEAGTSRACYGGPDGTQGVGRCRAGTQTCAGDGTGYGPCTGQALPQVEVCNGADDDCDGLVDDAEGVGEACAVGTGACRVAGALACDAGTGQVVCDAEAAPAGVEACNGVDDDCDGVVDDVAGLGDACTAGQGACARSGQRVCGPDGLVCDAQAGAPGAEICNGRDDDCDGQVDEGVPGVGEACSAGQGACRAQGQTVCRGMAGLGCDANAGAPAPEACNAVDDDCDGTVDEDADGGPCAAGVGACRVEGVVRCAAGQLACDAVAGPADVEVCAPADEDCDGFTDEGNVCAVYASCLEARRDGVVDSGVLRLQPAGAAAPVDVYCDQQTDGGGWTLVGSTAGATLNDQAADWYADLRTLAPSGAHEGIWRGLRDAAPGFDVRFACRDSRAAAGAPMTVDLSFYKTPWYHEFTAGTDADSCFSEGNGEGQDRPPPARRDNVGGVLLGTGTRWAAGYLEGEDTCSSTADFTVDLDDRGMDSQQSDGTDWGEDDGALKCGVSGLGDGQWFVFVRESRAPQGPPACPADDAWEDADAIADAWPIAVGYEPIEAVICGTDRDWYAFTGHAGCTVTATVRFVDADGDIDARLYDSNGTGVVTGASVSDDEVLTWTVPAAADAWVRLEVYGFNFAAAASNSYTVQVSEVCP